MDYKKTLNLLTTPFNMKANLGVREPEIQQIWLKKQIYQKVLAKNINNPHWILHDGPPYANGNIHVGHAVNKILKDIVVRIKSFQGFYSPYIAGWDTHGLPIEWALIKQGKNADSNLSVIQKRLNCKNFATEQIEIQKSQFSRFGLLSDLKTIYKTYDHSFEMDQLAIFVKMLKKNLVYQARKPVYWSWSSKTALAEAELVYINRESPSIYVKCPTTKTFKDIPVNTNLLIWTTTPWTLPSNMAIAVHPHLIYLLVLVDDQYYLVAQSRLNALTELLKWQQVQVVAKYNGKDLEYLSYKNLLLNEVHFVVIADYVSADDGTGLVHNAPGFGLDDYMVCSKYDIPIYCPIGENGKFNHEVKLEDLKHVFYEDANKTIIVKLQAANALLHSTTIVHSAAHDWRTNKPLIFRASYQWFVNIDNIKNDIIKACTTIKSYPKWILKQLEDTVLRRKEWCISRQRIWGVPIPILFDANDQPILDIDQINYTCQILNEKGCDSWFDLPATAFLAPKYQHLKNITKSSDIMDVWFDSGTSYSILSRHGLKNQCELYLEGSDQFRGWFNSSLITSVIAFDQSPYLNLISHGFVLDEHGFKMSKSKQNVVDPLVVMQEHGADVLRLWAASTDYSEDMRLGKIVFDQTINSYRKIRNSLLRFSLANLSDFDPQTNLQTSLSEVHQFVLHTFKQMVHQFLNHINGFAFYKAVKEFNNFVTFYSGWYLNLIKDTLYCDHPTSLNRLQAQTVLYKILKTALIMLAPFIPHTVEEAYGFLNVVNKQESIHLENWIDLEWLGNYQIDQAKWDFFFKLKNHVNEACEQLRDAKYIKQNTDAKIRLNPTYQNDYFSLFELKNLLMVGEIEYANFVFPSHQHAIACYSFLPICPRCKLHYQDADLAASKLSKRCQSVMDLVCKNL